MIKGVSLHIVACIVWLMSFIVTYLAIPRIIRILQHLKLFDIPNKRSSHTVKTPSMGGIAFYLSFISSMLFISIYLNKAYSLAIIFGVTVMFFMGIKDDTAIIRPQSKVISQIAVALVMVFFVDFQVTSFQGFLFVDIIPMWVTILLGCFVVSVVVNAYNLIDGIDGLAAMTGIVISGIFSYLFYLLKEDFFFLFAISVTAFLFAFLRFNLSKKAKIFMGDTGTMIVGFIISIFSLRLLALNKLELKLLDATSSYGHFLLLFAILFIPLVDFIRIFFIRLFKGENPFLADRLHIHHVFIDKLRLSHVQTSLLLTIINVVVFVATYLLVVKTR